MTQEVSWTPTSTREELIALSDAAARDAAEWRQTQTSYTGNAAGATGKLREALILSLESVRLAILAAAAPPHDLIAEVPSGDTGIWARVELFGHAVKYGEVVEVERFGRRWLEVVVPAQWRDEEDPDLDNPDAAEERKLYHPNAVYAIQEDGEDSIRKTLRRLRGLDLVPRPEPWRDDSDDDLP